MEEISPASDNVLNRDFSSDVPNAELVNTMLDAAIDKVAASGERPVMHSDRGGHYRWPGWPARIADAKLVRATSRKGCSPDNAASEGFFGRLKTEMFFARDWLSTTIDEFVAPVDAHIRCYNEVRTKSPLGFHSPTEHQRCLGFAAQPVQEFVHTGAQFSVGANTLGSHP